jgi:hypothetical protein
MAFVSILQANDMDDLALSRLRQLAEAAARHGFANVNAEKR